jgi:peptide/nickel transport system ATP-binding protein
VGGDRAPDAGRPGAATPGAGAAPGSPVLEVRGLGITYFTSAGPVRAVEDVSFDLGRGETLGIVGESGCGKSTIAAGLIRMPAPPGRIVAGSVAIEGANIMGLDERELRRDVRWTRISMVFQGAMNSLTPVHTVGRHMRETLQEHRPMPRPRADALIARALELVGLAPVVARRYPHELSGGMKQRVVIAMALYLEPAVVVLDEPTTALDVIVQAQIVNAIKGLKARLGLSMVFITHDLALEAEVADRVLVMYAGRVAEIAPNERLFGGRACHPYTQRLLAATPRLRADAPFAFIPGAPPDLLDPPRGCRFHPRCPVALDRCRTEEPPLVAVAPGHVAACWRCGGE